MDADMAGISDLSEISSKAPFGHTGINVQQPSMVIVSRPKLF